MLAKNARGAICAADDKEAAVHISIPAVATAPHPKDGDPARLQSPAASRTLLVYYSQSGQTRRAAELLALRLGLDTADAARWRKLEDDPGIVGKYPMPWSFFGFLKAQPGSLRPRERFETHGAIDAATFDTLVLLYPVWFLSPASPIGAWLRQLPAGALAGKRVVTVCTSRNMWVEAQRLVREQVEAKGGAVVAHAALEDRNPEVKTLVTTLHFFLTGNKQFQSEKCRSAFPAFGIADAEYARLCDFIDAVARMQPDDRIAAYDIKPRRVLAEIVGRRISRVYCALWPVMRHLPRPVGDAYMGLVAVATMLSIIVLMPPTALLVKLPGLSRLIQRWPDKMLSKVN
jgi:hypothetical protein